MDNYYMDQCGSGIATYRGRRYQRGHGFLGSFFRGAVAPLLQRALPYLGHAAIDGASQIARQMANGEKFRVAAKQVARAKARQAISDGLVKVAKMRGEGVRKRKTAAKRKVKKRKTVKRIAEKLF